MCGYILWHQHVRTLVHSVHHHHAPGPGNAPRQSTQCWQKEWSACTDIVNTEGILPEAGSKVQCSTLCLFVHHRPAQLIISLVLLKISRFSQQNTRFLILMPLLMLCLLPGIPSSLRPSLSFWWTSILEVSVQRPLPLGSIPSLLWAKLHWPLSPLNTLLILLV